MQDTEIIGRLVAVEEGRKSNTKRLDKIEGTIENMYELTASVKEIATEVKMMRGDVNKMDNRLNILEEEPGQNWKKLKWIIITRNCNCNFGLFFRKNWIIERKEGEQIWK